MANTLTGLIDYIYQSADVVSRELTGLIPSVYLNAAAEQAAVNQDITYDVVPTMAAENTTAAAVPPSLVDQTVGTGTMKLTKSRTVRFYWSGEDEAALGSKRSAVENNKFAQAFRTLANEIETDLAALYPNASRAYGTAGTAPFGTAGDFSDAAQIVKVLKDNGAPTSDIQLVINTAAGANIIGKQSRYDILGAKTQSLQEQGILIPIAGCKIRESAQIKAHTKGTNASAATTDNAGYAVGATTLTLASAGTGTIVAGDCITFAGDTGNIYIVNTGDTSVADGGTVVLNNPGIRVAMSAATKAITLGANYSANMCFDRSAIHLLARLPKLPSGGDQADDEYIMVDPISGIPFRIALYRGYMANQIAIQVAWGVKAVKPEHIAILLG
jgi:hypothetical protein